MEIFSITDKGKVRQTNQDSYYACRLDDGAVYAIVCDGMGGAAAGNVASENAVRHISDYLLKSYQSSLDEVELEKLVRNAVVSANIELYDMAVNNAELSGMGTTVVFALVRDGTAIIAHVGDSRIYLVNEGIKQLTRDHSVVQSLIESGKITPEDAKVHPRKNVITRALGAEENVAVDTAVVNLCDKDSLLLCTDGLSNYIEDSGILEIFKNNNSTDIPKALVDKANGNGGGDNITAVILCR